MNMDRRLAEHLTYLRFHTTPRQWGLIVEGLRHGNDPYDLSIPPPLPGDPHPAFSGGPHYREGQMLATLRDVYPDREYQIVDGEGAPILRTIPMQGSNVTEALGFGITVRLFVHTVHHWEPHPPNRHDWERPTGDGPSLYEQVIYLRRPQVREEPPLGGLPLGFEAHELVEWQGPAQDPESISLFVLRLGRLFGLLGTLAILFGLASTTMLLLGVSFLSMSIGLTLTVTYLGYPRR